MNIIFSIKIKYPYNKNPYLYTMMDNNTFFKAVLIINELASEEISIEEFAAALSIQML